MEVDVQPWSSLVDELMRRGYRQSSAAKSKRVDKESCSVLLVDQTKKSENEQSLEKSDFDEVDWS